MVERRSSKDWLIAKILSFITRSMYRDIEIYAPADVPHDTPRLTVANHFAGFPDILVLLYVMDRRPGFVASDKLWTMPVVRNVLNWFGAIPVHRRSDHGGEAAGNDAMFASCYQALAERGHIVIFPEGLTHNEPSIAPVKTGAARIALGARATGVSDIHILPVGIHYEDKAALRSRVFVNASAPIDLDREVETHLPHGDVDETDREVVRDLTDAIDVTLRRAAPDYADWGEAAALAEGAEVALRSQLDDPGADVPIGLRDRLANTLADRPEAQRRRIQDAVTEYRGVLDGVGRTDAELQGAVSTRRFVLRLIGQLVLGVLLAPFALIGAVIHVIPYLVVKLVGSMTAPPSVIATLKPVAALLGFGITWGIVIWQAARLGWFAAVIAAVLLPFYLAAVIMFSDRLALAWRAFRQWRAAHPGDGLATHVADRRRAVVEAVLE